MALITEAGFQNYLLPVFVAAQKYDATTGHKVLDAGFNIKQCIFLFAFRHVIRICYYNCPYYFTNIKNSGLTLLNIVSDYLGSYLHQFQNLHWVLFESYNYPLYERRVLQDRARNIL